MAAPPTYTSPIDYGQVFGDAYTFTTGAADLDLTKNPGNGNVDMGPINAIEFLNSPGLGTFHYQTLSGGTDTWTITAGQAYEGLRIVTVLSDTTVHGMHIRVRW